MINNEILYSLIPENSRFVSGQDINVYVPKANTTNRYGIALYDPNDFTIDSTGKVSLTVHGSDIQGYLQEIRGGTREQTVTADPPINLLTLHNKDVSLDSDIATLTSVDDKICGSLGKAGTIDATTPINLSTLTAVDSLLDAKIDALINDSLLSSTTHTYSINKIVNLIETAKSEILKFAGYVGATVGKSYEGQDIIKNGAYWHVSSETGKPSISESWAANTMYKCVDGVWVQETAAYTPRDFQLFKNVNVPDSVPNIYWFLQGQFELLDFTVDMSNYYTKTQADALFKTLFTYGSYLSEDENHVLNIDTSTLPTYAENSVFDNSGTILSSTNVDDAIKEVFTSLNTEIGYLSAYARILEPTDTPTRAGDYSFAQDGVYKSVSDGEGGFQWSLLTYDLDNFVVKLNTQDDALAITDITFYQQGSSFLGKYSGYNINDGVLKSNTAVTAVPVATSSADGIMPATAMVALTNLDSRVSALEGGTPAYIVTFPSDNPSQEALTLLYQNVSGSSSTPPNLTRLIDVQRNLYYEYYTSLSTHWQGPYTYRQGVAGIGVLGLVSGSNTNGQIYVEPVTGVMSLNGYDSIIAEFTSLYGGSGRTAIDVTKVPNLPTSKITSGTFSTDRLPTIPVTKGGTGVTSQTANSMLFTGATDSATMRVGASFGAVNTILTSNGSGSLPTFQVPNYNNTSNQPITNADLSSLSAASAVANQTYRHTGTTSSSFVQNKLYVSNGTEWQEIGTGAGGSSKIIILGDSE